MKSITKKYTNMPLPLVFHDFIKAWLSFNLAIFLYLSRSSTICRSQFVVKITIRNEQINIGKRMNNKT